MKGNICIKKQIIPISGQTNTQIHFLPRIFLCSGFFRSSKKLIKFTIKHIGVTSIDNPTVS